MPQVHVDIGGDGRCQDEGNDANPHPVDAHARLDVGGDRLMTMLLQAFPGASIRRMQCRFLAPVITPAELVASGTVESRERVAGAEILHVVLELRARGTPAIAARAVVSIPEASP